MSILDILGGGNPLGAVLDAMTGGQGGRSGGFGAPASGQGGFGGLGDLGGGIGDILSSIANKAGSVAASARDAAPGGMGGLMGAGALGAVLGNLLGGNAVKGIALAGASAVAWNFYKKWAASQSEAATPESGTGAGGGASMQFGDPVNALPPANNDVSELVMRSMIYAARADGTIQPEEKERIETVMATMFPGADTRSIMAKVSFEPLDPAVIARSVKSHEQGEDVYRLSCATIDIDHFMERGYLDALAKSLRIDEASQKQIEAEAQEAQKQLEAVVRR